MKNEVLFLMVAGIICLLFSLWQGLQLLFLYKKTDTAKAIVTELSYAIANQTKFRNAKWARISFEYNQKLYAPEKRIQVPMTTEIGDKIIVRYFIDNPNKLAAFSFSKFITAFITAIFFFLMAKRA